MPLLSRRNAGAGRGGLQPLSHRRKWIVITLATVVLAPAYWAMLIGLTAVADDDSKLTESTAAASIAFGLAVIPFTFVVLAFGSEHPRAPGAVVKAMGMCLLVGILVSALAGDGVTGIVAGVGAGGAVSLRADLVHEWRPRAVGVLLAASYVFVLVRVPSDVVLISAPVFPFTAIGMADHWSERRVRGGT